MGKKELIVGDGLLEPVGLLFLPSHSGSLFSLFFFSPSYHTS